jgi:ParB family chromosome partitioning protein
MQVAINDIRVGRRVRRDKGDISALADSMRRLGQIQPVLISANYELIAGGRRIEAAKSLGWKNINAVVADMPQKESRLEYEIEENLCRKPFTEEEAAMGQARLERLRNPSWWKRFWQYIAHIFRKVFHK